MDQGIALIHFPFEDRGLLEAIRTLERNSFSSFFHSGRVKSWLMDESTDMETLLDILVGDPAYYQQYILDQQFGHRGWSGIIHAIEETPETLLYSKSISLKEFIILELLLEIDALDRSLGTSWRPLAQGIAFDPEDYFAPVAEAILKLLLRKNDALRSMEGSLSERAERLVRLNIARQSADLLDAAFIGNKIQAHDLELHGLVFDRDSRQFSEITLAV